tara:strand:- start:1328 stop:1561 length:234 start_codon:yes stop_codon:yes gene_type:complete
MKFKKIKFCNSMLGTDVTVFTNESAKNSAFEANKSYTGKLKEKKDWLVGCPVFECEIGSLALGYDCFLVEKLEESKK